MKKLTHTGKWSESLYTPTQYGAIQIARSLPKEGDFLVIEDSEVSAEILVLVKKGYVDMTEFADVDEHVDDVDNEIEDELDEDLDAIVDETLDEKDEEV